MTFSYDAALGSDRDFVRFHIGDVRADEARFDDATLDALLALAGTREGAVLLALEGLLAQLAGPDFAADWLRVDVSAARAGVLALLAAKRRAFGVDAVRARRVGTVRADGGPAGCAPDHDGLGSAAW